MEKGKVREIGTVGGTVFTDPDFVRMMPGTGFVLGWINAPEVTTIPVTAVDFVTVLYPDEESVKALFAEKGAAGDDRAKIAA